MGKISQLCTPLAFVGLLVLSTTKSAVGCGFHNLQMPIESMYPGSLTVAVALRTAANDGVVNASVEAPGVDADLYTDSVDRLQRFREHLAASPTAAELPASFSLGYVGSHLWTRYSQSDGEVRVDIHTDGPTEGEAVVLTGEPALTAVLAGGLSVDRALADGMLLIEGSESEKTAIRHALQAASTANRVSRR